MQVDWWLQPEMLCSATPTVWHMRQKYKSTQLDDSIEGPAKDSIIYNK